VTSDSFPGRAGTIVAGRYRLERELGAGGMGEVYVAIQEPLGRQVALKLMRAGLKGSSAQRFEREAKSLAAITHPNIVTLFDYGRTDDGELFMVMELLPGMTLRAHVARRGRLAPAEALPIVVDICRALEATHRGGIVHRDLKPENVMLVDVGGGAPIVKVLDFGIARLHDVPDGDARLTQTGHLVGTPGYMAPETVLEGVLDDPRSDLYAVGVILWEMLTNHPLFQALTPIALVMKHALEPPPTLTATLSLTTLPHPALEGLLARLLHKDRHQRFPSASAVIDAIAALPREALVPIDGGVAAGPVPIVNIDPSAPTISQTRAPFPTPATPALSPPMLAASVTMSTPAPPRSVMVVAALVGALVVVVVALVLLLLWPRDAPVPVLLPPPPVAAPAPPPVAAPVVPPVLVSVPVPVVPPPPPALPSTKKPRLTPPRSPPTESTVPHVPDLR
jgi:serine/threonine-protein kinase